jgi:hypothetical protein
MSLFWASLLARSLREGGEWNGGRRRAPAKRACIVRSGHFRCKLTLKEKYSVHRDIEGLRTASLNYRAGRGKHADDRRLHCMNVR